MALDNIDELDVKNASPFPTALRYGMIGGLLCLVIGFIQYLLGVHSMTSLVIGALAMLFAIIFPVLAIRTHRNRDLGGYISYGRGFGTGLLTALIIGLINAIWIIILFHVIAPTGSEVTLYEDAIKESGMSEEALENAMAKTDILMTLYAAAATMVVYTVLGLIASLIAAAVLRNDA